MRLAILPLLLGAAPAWATQPPAAPAVGRPVSAPVTMESYYRIRWGSFWDFMAIYREHHAPVQAELQRRGFITAIRTETPVTHMAGDQRWDLRVRITYRDGNAALGADGGAYEHVVREASTRLFPDNEARLAAQSRRFAMLEEHWDVVVGNMESEASHGAIALANSDSRKLGPFRIFAQFKEICGKSICG